MATLALAAVGSVVGSALLPTGISLLGATITGAAIGQAVGTLAGGLIDQALFGSSGQTKPVEGPRLTDLHLSGSTEGAPLPRIYGRARVGGQLIWATRLEEQQVTTTQSGGGKGIGGGGSSSSQTTIEYRYFANVAYGLCEGEIGRVGRIWADGKELNQSEYTIRVYKGTETQAPDSLIEAKEGAGFAPAYRGTAYIVFERMPLAKFGNRLPQLSFEVFRPVDQFEKSIKAVTLIPAAGEWAYEPTEVHRFVGSGATTPENVHTTQGSTDWEVSLDQMKDTIPNVANVSIFSAWFGDDLRAGSCQIKPRVENDDKATTPKSWAAAGLNRDTAPLITTHDGVVAYGSSPADSSVVDAIQDLKARGYAVTFCPFLLMDVPTSNSLPNPYGGASQPAYPWRGRITCYPAAGQPGTVDKTATAATQVAAFVGSCAVSDFTVTGETVAYSGPAEWGYRRFILHHAALCKAAGGVDTFIIGSEMRGMSWIRSDASTYPFVAALVALAADVKTMLGSGTKVTYGADWSEYFGHQPGDGTGDLYFHLDPLWSSSSIDAIGIDNYWPLSDWRDGASHLDKADGFNSIYDLGYLKSRIAGGEGYDWYYASQEDREAQDRSPITDGAGKPWVWRFKDIKSWWQSEHFNRPAGVESGSPTAWVPQSKPIWFTELGCPAVDKGSNQPNVFIDPKSSESFYPYFSRRTRDDLIQRKHLQAFLEYYDPAHDEFVAANNPASTVYTGRMVDHTRIYIYTWDARAYPAFPYAQDVWADGVNWELGHWLNGRLAGGPLAAVVGKMLEDYEFTSFATGQLEGIVEGYVLDRIMSVRDALSPLELAFFFDSFESGPLIRFSHRGQGGTVAVVTPDDLVDGGEATDLYTLTRGQETELPVSAKITYIDGGAAYRQAAVEARRLTGRSSRVSEAQVPIVMGQAQAQAIAEVWMQDAWMGRERIKLAMPPSLLAIEPSDVCELVADGRTTTFRITTARDGGAKDVEGFSIEPDLFLGVRSPLRVTRPPVAPAFGQAIGLFLDLPLLTGLEPEQAGYAAAFASPWPGQVAFYRSPGTTGFTLNTTARVQATTGLTETALNAGPLAVWDYGNVLRVKLDAGQLASGTELDVLGGANIAAVQNADGEWEVIQFLTATLVADRTYDLSGLLRGQGGTEFAMRSPVAAGARFVVIDAAITPVAMTRDEVGTGFNWKYGPANRDIAHLSYKDATHTFKGLGLKPLSPCYVKAALAGDDIVITWLRRTRRGGDSWDQLEVPLAEDAEMYEVDVLDGATVVRTLSAATPAVTYTEAMQVADFGSAQTSLTVAVYQVSPSFGRGTKKQVTLAVS